MPWLSFFWPLVSICVRMDLFVVVVVVVVLVIVVSKMVHVMVSFSSIEWRQELVMCLYRIWVKQIPRSCLSQRAAWGGLMSRY